MATGTRQITHLAWPQDVKDAVDLISRILALVGALLGAIWVYTKFILERGLLPPSQFDIDVTFIGAQRQRLLLEVLLKVKNVGTSALVLKNLRIDIRTIDAEDDVELFLEEFDSSGTRVDPRFGRLKFPRSLRSELTRQRKLEARSLASPGGNEAARTQERGMAVVEYATFVGAGVEQQYTFVSAIPESTTFVLIWSRFSYAQQPRAIPGFIYALSRRLGLVQFSLSHITEPHTVERVFRVPNGR